MDTSTLQLIQITSFAPVALLAVWKIGIPLTNLLIARFNKTDTSAQARLDGIEGNAIHDLPDFKRRVYAIENRLDSIQSDFQKQFGMIGERLAVLEERTKK